MIEKRQPDSLPADELQISTPVIDMQDLEHNPGPATRVANKGVRVEPRMDSAERRYREQDDEDAIVALEQIEKAIRGQLPG